VYPVLLQVTNAQGSSSTAHVAITVVASDAPAIATVVDSASLTPGISPGSMALLSGFRLSSASGVANAASYPLPLQLQGTSVKVNGTAAPLFSVVNVQGSEQISFQVPVETAGPGEARIVVSAGGHDSAQADVPVLPAKPGVFTLVGIGPAIMHSSNGTLVTAASPARAGEVVVIYCTGLGAVAPVVPTGNAASRTPLSQVVLPITVTVGGKEAVVDFAGLAPNYVGLYQINVEIPAGVGGASVPVAVEVSGSQSNQVGVAISP
jgi:uncharacterized protein (TIGR03437 family)